MAEIDPFDQATVLHIWPEYYPRTLWIGRVLTIQEGSMIVGYAEITQIYNDILIKVD